MKYYYTITKMTKDVLENWIYADLVEQLLKDHGAVQITEDEYGCIIDVREIEKKAPHDEGIISCKIGGE